MDLKSHVSDELRLTPSKFMIVFLSNTNTCFVQTSEWFCIVD